MGRGSGWNDVELEHLARAWLYASENPINGIDQSAWRFKETMLKKLKELSPPNPTEKTYGARTPKHVRAKCDKVSADIEQLRESNRLVRGSNRTGVTADEICVHGNCEEPREARQCVLR